MKTFEIELECTTLKRSTYTVVIPGDNQEQAEAIALEIANNYWRPYNYKITKTIAHDGLVGVLVDTSSWEE